MIRKSGQERKQTMRRTIAALAAAAAVLGLAGCGSAPSISIGTIDEGAQHLVKALESGDPAKLKALGAADKEDQHLKIIDVKPTKAVTDAKVASIAKNTATITYKVGGQQLKSKVEFRLHVDGQGNASYLPWKTPFVETEYAGMKLNGKSLGNKTGDSVYVMPGEYSLAYSDDVVDASGTIDTGIGSRIMFDDDDDDAKLIDSEGNVNVSKLTKPNKGYAAAVKQELIDATKEYECYSDECKTFPEDSRIDVSGVKVETTGSGFDDVKFSGTARVTVMTFNGWISQKFENRTVDINQLEPEVSTGAPGAYGDDDRGTGTKVYVDFLNADEVLDQSDTD